MGPFSRSCLTFRKFRDYLISYHIYSLSRPFPSLRLYPGMSLNMWILIWLIGDVIHDGFSVILMKEGEVGGGLGGGRKIDYGN